MDIATVIGLTGTAAQTVLTATEIGKNLKQVFRGAEVDVAGGKQLVLELLDKLIDAKAAQVEIHEAVLALQREIEQRDQFETDLSRYVLQDTGRGATVYRLKSDDSSGEPPHSICPACVANRKKAILQPATGRANCLTCPVCNAHFLAALGHSMAIARQSSRTGNPWGEF